MTVTALCVNSFNVVTFRLRPALLSLPLEWLTCGVFWAFFVVLWLAVRLLISLLARLVKWERLHGTTQGFGMLLGGARGVWWAGWWLIVLTASGIPYLQESVTARSVSAPWLLEPARNAVEWVSDHVPGSQYRIRTLVPPLPVQEPSATRRER